HPLERLGVDHQQLGVLRHHRRGVARLVGDDRHLPEELARPQHRQHLLHVAHALGDRHPPGLEDEHLLARLPLAEEHCPLGELLPEALEEGLLGTHGFAKSPPTLLGGPARGYFVVAVYTPSHWGGGGWTRYSFISSR